MRNFGYSTGAIAKGDIAAALDCLVQTPAQAVEFSALRVSELQPILAYLAQHLLQHDAGRFPYCSFHVPSRFDADEEPAIVRALAPLVAKKWPIIIHPDTIHHWELWRCFGSQLLIENMDQRKGTGRTVDELSHVFDELPQAGLCLDLGHLRQMDPTMVEAYRIIKRHGNRIRQLHLSDVDSSSKHHPLNIPALTCFMRVAPLLNRSVPVILESPVACSEVHGQLMMAQILFAAADAHRWKNAQSHIAAHQHGVASREVGLSVDGTPLRIRGDEEESQVLKYFGSWRELRQRTDPASWHYFRRAFFPAAGLEGSILDEQEQREQTPMSFDI